MKWLSTEEIRPADVQSKHEVVASAAACPWGFLNCLSPSGMSVVQELAIRRLALTKVRARTYLLNYRNSHMSVRHNSGYATYDSYENVCEEEAGEGTESRFEQRDSTEESGTPSQAKRINSPTWSVWPKGGGAGLETVMDSTDHFPEQMRNRFLRRALVLRKSAKYTQGSGRVQ